MISFSQVVYVVAYFMVVGFVFGMMWWLAQIAEKADKVVQKVDQIQNVLRMTDDETGMKLSSLKEAVAATHALVNSGMVIQLQLNAELSRWKADQMRRLEDEVAADLAEKLRREHEAKQQVLDDRAAGAQIKPWASK